MTDFTALGVLKRPRNPISDPEHWPQSQFAGRSVKKKQMLSVLDKAIETMEAQQ